MNPTRRAAMMQMVAGVGAMSAGRALADAPRLAASRTPTRFVFVRLKGGIDSLYSWDPKIRNQVDPRVQIPYSAKDIVRSGALSLAPLCQPLAAFHQRIAIVNGVECGTVSHEYGVIQLGHLSNDFLDAEEATLATRVGQVLGSTPIHSLEFELGPLIKIGHRPTRGKKLALDQMGDLYKEYKRMKASDRLYGVVVDRLRKKTRASSDDAVRESAAMVLYLLERIDPSWRAAPGPKDAPLGALQYVPELLANDVVRSIAVDYSRGWDSHGFNHRMQTMNVGYTSKALAWLLSQLEARPVAGGGSLLDQTLIVVTSELGRFPFVNNRKGKDHYPVVPVLFAGAGVRSGMYGATDRVLAGTGTSLSTGRPTAKGGAMIHINDIGHTIRQRFGLPTYASSKGRTLGFLYG